jgi:hypothetical protein
MVGAPEINPLQSPSALMCWVLNFKKLSTLSIWPLSSLLYEAPAWRVSTSLNQEGISLRCGLPFKINNSF